MNPNIWLVLLIAMWATGLPYQQWASFIIALQEQLQAGSVVIFYSENSGLKQQADLAGLLRKAQVPTVTSVHSSPRMFDTSNKSLHVILSPLQITTQELCLLLQTRYGPKPTWVMFMESGSIQTYFATVYIPVDREVIVLQTDGSMVEVYHLQDRLQVTAVGTWSSLQGLTWTHSGFLKRRSDLKGTVIRAATIHNPPISVLHTRNGKITAVGGYFGEVWSILEQHMNFTTVFSKPEDGAWGAVQDNGSWNGMTAMILRREVDIAVSEFSIIPTRTAVMDFTIPLLFTRFCVLIREPGSSYSGWGSFLAPFSTGLWLFILLTILMVSLHLAATRYIHQTSPIPSGILYAIFQVYGIFCQQGMEDTPRYLSGRTLCLAAYVTVTVILAAYSASLVSFLAVRRSVLPFSTLAGLLHKRSHSLAVLRNSGQLNYFDRAVEPLMKSIYKELIYPQRDDLPANVHEGLMRICTHSNYAFMTSLDIALALLKDVPCRVVPVIGASLPDSLSMVLPKRSPFRDLLNYNLQELKCTGVLARIQANAWSKEMPPMKSKWSEVGLETITPALVIVLVGALSAFIFLLAERFLRPRLDLRPRLNCMTREMSA